MAGARRRAKQGAGWIKSWSSRWRRPTAACQCVFQRSTPSCTPSTKTGCRATTPRRPASYCTPSTKARTRATRSPPTCSGDKREEVWTGTGPKSFYRSLWDAQPSDCAILLLTAAVLPFGHKGGGGCCFHHRGDLFCQSWAYIGMKVQNIPPYAD